MDPSDEELALNWTLTAEDIAEVRRCRGDDNRHRFALQLCAVRALCRFADDCESIPVRVVNHIGAQLELPTTLFDKGAERAATDIEHAHRIRAHLGYRTFDEQAQERLAALLEARSTDGLASASLLGAAVDAPRVWKTEIPAVFSLGQLFRVITMPCEITGALVNKGQCSQVRDKDDLVAMPWVTFQSRMVGRDRRTCANGISRADAHARD